MKHVTLSCSNVALCSLGVFDRRCGRSAFYLLLQKQSGWVMGKNEERLPVMKVYTGSIHALLRWHALRKISSRHKWQGETVPRKDEPARFFWFSCQKWPAFWSNSLSKSLLSPQYDPTSWSAIGNTSNKTKPQQIKHWSLHSKPTKGIFSEGILYYSTPPFGFFGGVGHVESRI